MKMAGLVRSMDNLENYARWAREVVRQASPVDTGQLMRILAFAAVMHSAARRLAEVWRIYLTPRLERG